MTTHPDELAGDERGAVMVMGIFMCACLVGGMWYVAGIGDALVLRERIQEASDAAALSGAVLHARGMNLIVLINLVMACILGMRVALKAAQLALVIVGGILTALSWLIPGAPMLASTCFSTAKGLDAPIKALKPVIDKALTALSKAELGMARVAPAAACAGGTEVAYKYRPLVTTAFAGVSADIIANGLPLQEGTADRLCFEAGKAVGDLLSWAVPLPSLGAAKGRFSSMLGSVVQKGGAYFCEMGGGGAAPNFDDIVNSAAKEFCDGKREGYVRELRKENAAWQQKCSAYGATCIEYDAFGYPRASMSGTEKLPPQQQAELTAAKQKRDTAQSTLDSFNNDACKKDKKKSLNAEVKANMPASGKAASGAGMTPKMVVPKWQNGVNSTQLMGWAWADTGILNRGRGGVKLGAQKSVVPKMDPPHGANFAFSQAEYFYDCAGPWAGKDCNGAGRKDNEGAMWHFKWRARLRRYNRPYNNLSSVLETPYVLPAHVELVARASKAKVFSLTSPGNIALKSQLTRFLNPADTLSVTFH